MIETALIGRGRWGGRVAQALASVSEFKGSAGRTGEPQWETLLSRQDVQAVWIATPIATHYSIALRALQMGKHVMVEKPLAETVYEAKELVDIANQKKLVLATGYVFLFDPVYRAWKKKVKERTVAAIKMSWNKFGSFEESIEMNLLTHHLAIALDLFGTPNAVRGIRKESVQTECDYISIGLSYDGFEVISEINRTAAQHEHTITADFSDGTSALWRARASQDPLFIEAAEFVDAVKKNKVLTVSNEFGVDVLMLHERVAKAFGR